MLVIQEVEHMRITHTQIHTHAHTLTHVHTHKHLFCANESYHTCEGAYLQCIAVCCSIMSRAWMLRISAVFCSVLQCVAVCCSVLQCVAASCNVPECCAYLQCVAVCCSVLQRYVTYLNVAHILHRQNACKHKQAENATHKKKKPTHQQTNAQSTSIIHRSTAHYELLCVGIPITRIMVLSVTRILTHCVRAH